MKNTFDLQPTLIGERVILRPVSLSDWESMFRAASDPQIWALHPAKTRYTETEFRKFFDGAVASGSAFAFIDKESGEIIGSSRYHEYNPEKSEIEIGWTFLARKYWGGSYNQEVKSLMLNHAFNYVDTVVFWVGDTNWRSQGAMEKIGGIRREGLFTRTINGSTGDNVVYEIRKQT